MASVALKTDQHDEPRVIRDSEFAKRLKQALDGNPQAPPAHGRGAWLRRSLEQRFGERGKVSPEGIRRWMAGEVKPSPDNVSMLAGLLDVNEAWLSLGLAPDLTPREQKLRNAVADGAVNLVAGLIQMNGGHPAFPEEGDKRAEHGHIDLYAIIKGAQYAFHISLAQVLDTGDVRFAVPFNHDEAVQLGVIPDGDFDFRIVEISPDLIDTHGQRRGLIYEVTIGDKEIEAARIRTFRTRL